MADLLPAIQLLARDCAKAGRGRKRWWAERLGIPPLTISHWLAGRQAPSGPKVEAILHYFRDQERASLGRECVRLLWSRYYAGGRVGDDEFPLLALGALKSPTLETRILALLVYFGRTVARLDFEEPVDPEFANRLGWLIESCGKASPFEPNPSPEPRPFIRVSEGATAGSAIMPYLRRQRTSLGARWYIWDAQVSGLVEGLAWKQLTSA